MAEGDEDGVRRFDEAGDVELEIDGVAVIYHRDRSVAWAMGDVEQAAHAEKLSSALARSPSW